MASLNSTLNPNVVKTALDKVFYPEFDGDRSPGLATAMTPDIFKQETIDRASITQEVFKGTGYWETRDEEEDVPMATPRVGDQITHVVSEFAQSVDIPKRFFDDEQHSVVNNMVRDMARTGQLTRDRNAFAIYRGAFSTTLTADGVSLISASHVNLAGDTVDNTVSGALTGPTLNDGIVALMEQVGQDSTIRGHVPMALLVAPAGFKNASELVDSELIADSPDNDINVFSSKYGIRIWQSPFLGAAAGGSDTAWFLLARNHSVTRWVREAMSTDLVDWRFQRNNVYIYKASFREVLGALTYEGIVGSTGV